MEKDFPFMFDIRYQSVIPVLLQSSFADVLSKKTDVIGPWLPLILG